MKKSLLEKARPIILLGGISALCITTGLTSFSKSQYKIVKESKIGTVLEKEPVLANYFTTGEWLSEDALLRIEQICNIPVAPVATPYDPRYLDILGINKENTKNTYESLQTIKANRKHRNTKYYDEEKDDIKWELLAEDCYIRSVNYKESDNNGIILDQPFSKEEIKEKIANIKQLTQNLRKDFKEFDMKEFACTLADYKFIKKLDYVSTALAYTTNDTVTYNTLFTHSLTKDEIKPIDLHEDFHIAVNGCSDKNTGLSSQKRGISVQNKDDKNVSNDNLLCIDNSSYNYNNSYSYNFLEEIYAELYSNSVLKTKQQNYINHDEILNALQISLGLRSNYQIDDILQDLVYHDPLSFIKRFPSFGERKEDYVVDNCKMLKAYDILLGDKSLYNQLLENSDLSDIYNYDSVNSLTLFASSQLTKNYFNNLIVMNEMHSKDMELEDNYYMINLFENTLKNTLNAIKEVNPKLSIRINDTSFYQTRTTFLGYLGDKYQLFPKDVESKYYREYSYTVPPEDYQGPSFFDDNKRLYYMTLLKEGENHNIKAPYNLPMGNSCKVHKKTK